MFFSDIKRFFNDPYIDIKERLSTVEATFCISRYQLTDIKQLIQICSDVPRRDVLEFNLDNCSEEIVSINNTGTNVDSIIEFLKDTYDEDEIAITIKIDKTVSDNKFSIYDYKSFLKDLLCHPILEIMQWFSKLLKDNSSLLFEVYDYDISFSTRTIAFRSINNSCFSPIIDRKKKISSCIENSSFYNMNMYELIPDDFILEESQNEEDNLRRLFDRIATLLSLFYIFSSASINNKDIIMQINGQKAIRCKIALDEVFPNNNWISIYNWIYADGNATDKKMIANNVMSLYCTNDNFFNVDFTMFEAIKTNYNLYLRNNVTHYLNMKREISNFIQNIVAQVSEYSLSIFSKFKNNILAMCGFLFTVVLTQIGSQQNWANIFTKHTIWLFELFLMGSLVYLLVCVIEARYRIKKIKIGYIELKSNYKDVLSQYEINEAFKNDSLFNEVNKSALIGIIVWSLIWAILLIIGILVIEFLTTNRGLIFWLWNKLT